MTTGRTDAWTTEHFEIQILKLEECQQALAAHEFGRLVVVVDGEPQVFPVNYQCVGSLVVVHTDPGLKLLALRTGALALAIDDIDRESQTGWSIVAHGRAFEIAPLDVAAHSETGSDVDEPWAGGGESNWIRLDATRITGRRVLTRR